MILTDRGKLKCWEENQSYYHFIHHKSHLEAPVFEHDPQQWKAGDSPPYIMHSLF